MKLRNLRIKPAKSLKEQLFFLSAGLAVLAIISAVWLDYLSFSQQDISYLPWASTTRKDSQTELSASDPQDSLAGFLRQKLEQAGLPPESISEELTKEDQTYILVRTTAKEYRRIKDDFLRALKDKKIKTSLREQTTDTGEVLVTVELKQKSRLRGYVVFRCPQPALANEPQKIPAIPEKEKPVSKVALVIDDLGEDLNFLNQLVALNLPLTVAIIPEAPLAQETAELAAKNGLEVIIHLPLEAFNMQISSAGADGLITTSMSVKEVRYILERDLSLLPQAKGLNNHMGSKATADEALMEIIMTFLKDKNLYFLDSRTSPKTVAYDLAIKKKVPAASRQVFLDADEDRNKVEDRMNELFNLARKNGQAIGIGHPYPETLKVLKTYLPKAKEYGLKVVPVSELVKR
ncbi:MAG: divergent polysaccharide deacetylase family protein [Acidobacteriota bacterium]|nr:divergent polysaccharide deacetylase family protein [Acidobacteriota bacterium]